MYRYIFIIFFSIIILACGTGSGVLPKEKMEKVLWDVAQSSEFLNSYVYFKHPEQNKAAVDNAMLERVFKIHNINKAQFDKTMEYYRKKPNILKEVLDTITARQSRIMGKPPAITTPELNNPL